jgi:hypothetical protein
MRQGKDGHGVEFSISSESSFQRSTEHQTEGHMLDPPGCFGGRLLSRRHGRVGVPFTNQIKILC